MRKRKPLRQFIRENREEIDTYITSLVGIRYKLNDNDRHQWLLNEEYLWRWARQEGVRL